MLKFTFEIKEKQNKLEFMKKYNDFVSRGTKKKDNLIDYPFL